MQKMTLHDYLFATVAYLRENPRHRDVVEITGEVNLNPVISSHDNLIDALNSAELEEDILDNNVHVVNVHGKYHVVDSMTMFVWMNDDINGAKKWVS